jgi:hypothetical protein
VGEGIWVLFIAACLHLSRVRYQVSLFGRALFRLRVLLLNEPSENTPPPTRISRKATPRTLRPS